MLLMRYTMIIRKGEINEDIKELDISWKIKDFFFIYSKCCISQSFIFSNESWYIICCPYRRIIERSHVAIPSGSDPGAQITEYISVYLVRESSGPPFKLKFSFSLKALNNKCDVGTQCTRESIFEERAMKNGFDKFISRSELIERKTKLVPSNTLTIVCTLKHPQSNEDPARNKICYELQHCKLLQDLKQLYLSQEDSDVNIKVKERDFTAHKVILKARSPVFAATFRNDMKEKATGIINIEDCDPSIFSQFLRFLYHGYVTDLSSENVFSLYAVADKYDVSDLKTECLQFMKKNLSVDTFFETMTLAQRHAETELIDLTNDFFVNNAQNIIKTAKWEQFLAENPTHGNKLFLEYMTSHMSSKTVTTK